MTDYFKHPAKRLDREFRGMGAIRIDRNARHVSYLFPDKAIHVLNNNIRQGAAKELLDTMRRRYGATVARDPLGYAEKRPGAPVLDFSKLIASKHAQIRLTQMQNQAGLEFQEVVLALRAPNRVLWSEIHESWLWVGERIAVAASVNILGEATIRTILWTQQELWDANPRPERVKA